MSLEQLTDGIRAKVAGGGIEESVKFDLGDAGFHFPARLRRQQRRR